MTCQRAGWDGPYVHFARVPLRRLWDLLTVSISFIVPLILSLRTQRTLFPRHRLQGSSHSHSCHPKSADSSWLHIRLWPMKQAREQPRKPRVSPPQSGFAVVGGRVWILVCTLWWLLLPSLYFVAFLWCAQLQLVWSYLLLEKHLFVSIEAINKMIF